MWQYKQPGFAPRLLCELQKQQQRSLHCDTLLQTEGVSIPAHSCLLSALSPVFCRAFANAPSLPAGHSRLVQLDPVRAHALMKLVGFMYSGEMEGSSLDEQQEVIDIAHRLGFSNFMKGNQKQVNRHPNKTSTRREIILQTEETAGRKNDASVLILSEKQSFSHSGTQTDSAEAHFVDTCVASEPELSTDLRDELTDVPSEYNSISPDGGLALTDEIVAHSPLNSAEALVRAHAKHQQTHKAKKKTKITKKEGTQISLKIKLKRQRSGALWEIVSVQEECTHNKSKTCEFFDDPQMTHSLAETHKSSVEVQLRTSSATLTCQNLETVTLTPPSELPPSELTTSLRATPSRPPLMHFHHHTPDPVPLSSPLQIPPLTPGLSQAEEADEHLAKLLEMVTVDLNILPSVSVEGNSSMHAHLDQKSEKCAAVFDSPASNLRLFGHDLGAVESKTTSGTSEQRETGSEGLSSCRKWDLRNVASVASYPTSSSYINPCNTEKEKIDSLFTLPSPVTDTEPSKITFGTEGAEHQNGTGLKNLSNNVFWGANTFAQTVSDASEDCEVQTQISRTAISNVTQDDATPERKQCPEQPHVTHHLIQNFSEMRLPRCLSPLTSDAGQTTGISTQDPLRPLECSSFLSASHVHLQPVLRYTSSPIQPQALPGKTNQQNPSCTSSYVNEIHYSVIQKKPWPSRSNREHGREANLGKSEEKKTQIPDFANELLKGTEENILDQQMNESAFRGVPTATCSVESVNEPYRKKAKLASYQNINPCSVKIRNISHPDKTQDITNPVTAKKMDCMNADKIRKSVSIERKPQKNLSQPFKSKGQEVSQDDVWDANQPSPLAAIHECGRFLQKRICAKTLMEDVSNISKFTHSSAVLNTSSPSRHHALQVTHKSQECVPTLQSGRWSKDHSVALPQTSTKVNELTKECPENNVPEPEMKKSFLEPARVVPDVNLNGDENKQPKRNDSLAKKTSFCDKIFHQTTFSVGTPDFTPNFLPINHQLRSILQTNDRRIGSSLPSSLTCKKFRQPPEPDHMSTKSIMDNNKEEKKDTTEESRMEKGVPRTDTNDNVLDKFKETRVENSSRNLKMCLGNGNFVNEAEISTNTNLSIRERVDWNPASQSCTVPPSRDSNNNFGMKNNLQEESTTALFNPFRPENTMEKPKKDGQIMENLFEVPVSSKSAEVKLIKTKELHMEGTGSTRIDNLEGQGDWNREKEKENTVRNKEDVKISRMKEYEGEISDIEVDVMDESAQTATGHGDEVVATGGNVYNIDVEESHMSVEMDDDGEACAYEEEISGQQILRTEVDVMQRDEDTLEMTSEMINTKASSIQGGEHPEFSSSSVDTVVTSAVFLPVVNTALAEDCSSAEEELVVDDITDPPLQPGTVVGTQCNTILEEEEKRGRRREEEDEEEEVDVTGEDSD